MSMAGDTVDPRALSAQADALAAKGDLAGSRGALARLTALAPDGLDNWMRLSAVCRRLGDPDAALDAIGGALRVDPLGFLPLLLKADLLDQLGRAEEAGETYGHALAQRPEKTPPQLAQIIAKAEALHAVYQQRREAALAGAADATGAALSDAEHARLARFRSNIVRRTKVYHSEPTHFHFPGLALGLLFTAH